MSLSTRDDLPACRLYSWSSIVCLFIGLEYVREPLSDVLKYCPAVKLWILINHGCFFYFYILLTYVVISNKELFDIFLSTFSFVPFKGNMLTIYQFPFL